MSDLKDLGAAEASGKVEKNVKLDEKEKNQVPLLSLYRYAQGWDYIYMSCGVLGALGVGAKPPETNTGS